MQLEIISKVLVFRCVSLAIYNIHTKKAFKLKDCSSLIELLISGMLLEQEFLVGINLFFFLYMYSLYFQNFTENGLRSMRSLYKLQEPASKLPTP